MALQNEIDERRRLIKTDSYSMSIGEIMNLYQSKEIHINPNFQRVFRWRPEQRTKFIESILLGIPLPPIFVSQRDDGVWDLIDGLQRLSTLLEFAGLLRRADDTIIPAPRLTKAKYLPSLENKIWENKQNPDDVDALTTNQRIDIKRAKFDVNIILRESTKDAKYDLFERINTGGTKLSEQEVRNCLLIMTNVAFYDEFEALAEFEDFKQCIAITDRARDERYDMELVARFLTLRNASRASLSGLVDVGTFLSENIVAMANTGPQWETEKDAFKRTFTLLHAALQESAFKRYDPERDRYLGGFLVSAFEVIAAGVGRNIDAWTGVPPAELATRAKAVWSQQAFKEKQGSGVRGTDRIANIVPFGHAFFAR